MQNNITLKDRLTQFLEYLDIGQAKFAKVAGLSKGFANNVGDSIRTDNLRKISDAYPQLNILWLTAGVGQMLNEGELSVQNDVVNAVTIPSDVWDVIKNQAASLKAKDEQMSKVIAMLEKEIDKKGEGAVSNYHVASTEVSE